MDLRQLEDSVGPVMMTMFRELQGIRIALESIAAPKPQGPKLDKDTQAVALMLTMEKPTKRKIAAALGFASHGSLTRERFPRFCKAWDQFAIMRTVTGGNGRSVTSLDGEDDFGNDDN